MAVDTWEVTLRGHWPESGPLEDQPEMEGNRHAVLAAWRAFAFVYGCEGRITPSPAWPPQMHSARECGSIQRFKTSSPRAMILPGGVPAGHWARRLKKMQTRSAQSTFVLMMEIVFC